MQQQDQAVSCVSSSYRKKTTKQKRYLVTLLFFATVCAPSLLAQAQNEGQRQSATPLFEISPTVNLLRMHLDGAPGQTFEGGDLYITFNPMRKLGFVGDLGFGNHNQKISDGAVRSYMFGPRFAYRNHTRFVPYVHTLMGFAHLEVDLPSLVRTHVESQRGFAMANGGGVDFIANRYLALRLMQLDYFPTAMIDGAGFQHNFRLQTGFTVRLGNR